MTEFLSGNLQTALWLLLFAVVAGFFWFHDRRSIQAGTLDGDVAPKRPLWFRLPSFGAAAKAAKVTRAVGEQPGGARTRAQLADELNKLAMARAEDAIRWYDAGRVWKKRLGAGLRLLAIMFTAAAGLQPLLAETFTFVAPLDSPGVPSILVAVAALLVLFDRFGGHTSGWIRFMKAQTSIDQALAAYKAGWLAERGIGVDIEEERMQRLLQRSLRLIRHVDQTVRDETDEWAAEFRRALAESERAVEDARRRMDSGSIEVMVTNYDGIPGGRWTLQVGDRAERSIAGPRAAETGVPVGMQLVRGSARFGSLLCQDERAVDVRAGAITPVEVTISVPEGAQVEEEPAGTASPATPAGSER